MLILLTALATGLGPVLPAQDAAGEKTITLEQFEEMFLAHRSQIDANNETATSNGQIGIFKEGFESLKNMLLSLTGL